MFLTTRGHYSTRAMIYLARHAQEGPVPVARIAKSEEISEKYLHQLLGAMKRAGIVRVVLGPHGGFALARPASEITIAQVLKVSEGDLALLECLFRTDLCHRAPDCPSRKLWENASRVLMDFLESQTLEMAARELPAVLAQKPKPKRGKAVSCK